MPLSERFSLAWLQEPEGLCLCVRDLPASDRGSDRETLIRRLSVVPVSLVEAGAVRQGMAGRWETRGTCTVFVPRFPFLPGMTYVVLLSAPEGDGVQVIGNLEARARGGASVATVTAVFPTARCLPLNHLRFYVHFSHPMREGEQSACVRLLDAGTGEELAEALLPTPPELWDSDRRRLTVLLDPGRIKRGLAPHEEAGYPLVEGRPFILEVDRGFRDAQGQPMRDGFRRRYEVGPPLRQRVDIRTGAISAPQSGGYQPLCLDFELPIDQALGMRCLTIVDANGERVRGVSNLVDGETIFTFVPQHPWVSGEYLLEINTRLEDVAGNSLARPFDRDLSEADPPKLGPTICVPFTVH